MSVRDEFRDLEQEEAARRGDRGRLVLGDVPAHDDVGGLCAWLTEAFALDPAHPIVKAERFGRGPEALVRLERAGAQPIRFEPFKLVSSPAKLFETLGGWTDPTDGATPAFKAEHCRQIYQVLRMACGATAAITDEQETAGLVGHFLSAAQLAEGFTIYGRAADRYDALEQLKPSAAAFLKQALVDRNTGEYVVRVGDLAEAARRYLGASIPHGLLDGRMGALGWTRKSLGAHSEPGRDGRRSGKHLHFDVYVGFLPRDDADDPAVNP